MSAATEATKPRTVSVQRSCGRCFGDGYIELSIDSATGIGRTDVCIRCGGTGFVEFERAVE